MQCGFNFYNMWYDSKTTINFFFLLHNLTDRGLILTTDLSNVNLSFFSFLIKSRTFTISLKRKHFTASLRHFGTASHHNFYMLGPLLSTIKVTWIQTLQYHDSWSGNMATRWSTGEKYTVWICWTKWMIHKQNKTEWNGVRFYLATQNPEQFKT